MGVAMMRYEFSKATKRAALARSDGFCEAVGQRYGLEPGARCNAPLDHGWEADHYPVPAGEKDSDVLDNCVACCKVCHKHKTRTYDIPMQAKDKRIRDRHQGIKQPKAKIRSRGFGRAPDNTKYLDRD
jgi:5-methylcytosine-specific restriction endonuclease McrA